MRKPKPEGKYHGASPDAIQNHYDRGTAFYKLWLDKTLTYSCGLWDGVASLEDAQNKKLDFHIRNAEAEGADRVVDVGCGWGSLLERAVGSFGVGHAVGLTLSSEQADYVRNRHLESIEVRQENWADHSAKNEYDAAFCLGMLEHCAHIDLDTEAKIEAYRRFFTTCHAWLRAGRCLSLQTICFGTLRELDEFIQTKIWPESNLPCLHEIVIASDGIFEIEKISSGRLDYSRTCREWAGNLGRMEAEAAAIVGETCVSDYLRFLKMSARAFDTGALNLYRIKLRRISRGA